MRPRLGTYICFRQFVLAACVFCVGVTYLCAQDAKSSQTIVVQAGKLFDPVAGRMLDHPVVVIVGNKITSVSSGTPPSISGASILDLGDATLLPGFIDVHTHLTSDAGGGGYEALGISAPRAALIGAKNARLTLLAGFTTVRNVGAEGYADVALRISLFRRRCRRRPGSSDAPGARSDQVWRRRDQVLCLWRCFFKR